MPFNRKIYSRKFYYSSPNLWLLSCILVLFIGSLELYCEYMEGAGNGKKKIKVDGEFTHQKCANRCLQLRRNGNEAINGATLDSTTCFCEMNQTRSFYSKQKMNCHFRTVENQEKGEYIILHFFPRLTLIYMTLFIS